MNPATFSRLVSLPHRGTYFRAVNSLYLATPFGSAHTRAASSRFNSGTVGSEILYLTEDPIAALFEVRGMVGVPWKPELSLPALGPSWSVVSADVDLRKVADLREMVQQEAIETSSQELSGDWEGYTLRALYARPPLSLLTGIAPTQQLGDYLSAAGFDGLLAPSAVTPYRTNVVIFPQSLAATGGSFSYTDPLTGAQMTLP